MYHRQFQEKINCCLPLTLQVSLIVPEIFKFKKMCKIYKWGDWWPHILNPVLHVYQVKKNYINQAILANLRHSPLKLGRLIALQETHMAIKILFPWQLSLFQSPPTWFQYMYVSNLNQATCILANLRHSSLKLGRLMALQETRNWL